MSKETNSFSKNEDIRASEDFARWQASSRETVDEYTLRRRKAELYRLVRTVIKNELDSFQQEFVRLHWYEQLPLAEVAQKMGIDRSTAFRKSQKISDILYDKLKYAVEYRFGSSFSKDVKVIVKTQLSPACTPFDGDSIARRVRDLRLSQSFSIADVSYATGISEQRLEAIENDGRSLNMQELKMLSTFYRTTTDMIVFGVGGMMGRAKQ